MFDDPYLSLTIGVQALRRKAEALGPALGGALGVAAEPYPHQLATVRRVLTDTTIRHLISDEVGLGKTVQALMILNALRYQNPNHKAVIVVPDRLVRQWLDECWTRAHVEATVFGEDADGLDTMVRIVRPQSIASGQFTLDPAAFDLLIVDEPQLLPDRVMRSVETWAADFRQVLVLSATPGLTDPDRRRRMTAILEPERAQIAENRSIDLDSYVSGLEQQALSAIDAGTVAPAMGWRTFSRERRILRATRRDWNRYLPARRYRRVETDPLEGEVARVSLGMQWLNEGREDEAFVWRAAQALHRGTDSARGQRRLRSNPHLEDAVRRSAQTPGDSRLDALLDVLTGIWGEHPDEQVIVVAGDNPTIDFLEARLRRYYADGDDDCPVSMLRRASERTEDEAADIEAMHRQLHDFSTGHSRLLLIGEWVQAGLNLHYFARNIVFYSSPWGIDAIDQLTGRLDRLRPNGLAKGDAGRHFGNIRIWTIVQPATPEARVIAALESLGVYDKPLPPLRPETEAAIAQALHAVAFNRASGAAGELADFARAWADQPTQTLLARYSPFSSQQAQREYDELQAIPLPQPVIGKSGGTSYTMRSEQALKGFLNLLHRANVFDVSVRKEKTDEELKFSTLWYGGDGRSPAIPLSVIPPGGWMAGHVPFHWRRKHLAKPPRNTVHYDDGNVGGRLLRFLDFGDTAHDEIVEGAIDLAKRLCRSVSDECVTVQFDPVHPAAEGLRGKQVYLAAGLFDPLDIFPAPDLQELEAHFAGAPTEAQRREADADRLRVLEWWRADVRWLRTIVPARLVAAGFVKGSDGWTTLPHGRVMQLLSPLDEAGTVLPRTRGKRTTVREELRRALDDSARRHLEAQARNAADQVRGNLADAVTARREQLEVELADLVASREAHHARVEAAEVEIDVRRAGMLAGLKRRIENARLAAETRSRWLEKISVEMGEVPITRLPGLMLQVSSTDAN